MSEFIPFPKIARLSREMVITEKIDGTNGLIEIAHDMPDSIRLDPAFNYDRGLSYTMADGQKRRMLVGSKSRYITPDSDNYGFARWAYEHVEELAKLEMGRHFGEWWGQGIQRGYGLTEKRFSLFNTSRWMDDAVRPACCHVVPVLHKGMFDTAEVVQCMEYLAHRGSVAAEGFKNPEGVVVFHVKGNLYFKKTINKDEEYKGKTA